MTRTNPPTTMRFTEADRQNAQVIIDSGAAQTFTGACQLALAMCAKGWVKVQKGKNK